MIPMQVDFLGFFVICTTLLLESEIAEWVDILKCLKYFESENYGIHRFLKVTKILALKFVLTILYYTSVIHKNFIHQTKVMVP